MCASGRRGAPAARAAQGARRRCAVVRAERSDSTTSWSLASGSVRGNELGEPIPIGEAAEHIAGYCLLNDWSARDIQAWEYQPLGPFLAKNFATTISPWIVTPEALAPFRVAQPRRRGRSRAPALSARRGRPARRCARLALEVLLLTPGCARPGSSAASAEPESSGEEHVLDGRADRRPPHLQRLQSPAGDLLGTGTISGPDAASCGSMLETTLGGPKPIVLASGETAASWRTETR